LGFAIYVFEKLAEGSAVDFIKNIDGACWVFLNFDPLVGNLNKTIFYSTEKKSIVPRPVSRSWAASETSPNFR
jgi:hypothetical protein